MRSCTPASRVDTRADIGPEVAPGAWHSFDLGSWHIVALDANYNKIGGCDPSSPEGTWLAADLATSQAPCTLAMWHQPAFSPSSQLGDVTNSLPLRQAVVEGGAELVLNGYRHVYERFTTMDPDGAADATGAREILVGIIPKDSFWKIRET